MRSGYHEIGLRHGRARGARGRQALDGVETHATELPSVLRCATLVLVRIKSFRHSGLRRLYVDDRTQGLPADAVKKLRQMLAFLENLTTPEELRSLAVWKPHQLTGDRKGTWALHVTKNWRLTFRIEQDEITEVNYEDYH